MRHIATASRVVPDPDLTGLRPTLRVGAREPARHLG